MPINNLSYTDRRIRREWRSLTINEQQNYIESVQCIQNLPSELVGRGNFYDDLVYVHYLVGSQSELIQVLFEFQGLNCLQHMEQPRSYPGIVRFCTYMNHFLPRDVV